MRPWIVILTLAAVGVAAAALLVILASGARHRGRLTHCRRNLVQLGRFAESQVTEGRGRAYWNKVREYQFANEMGEFTLLKFGGLNPFACPVRGVHPVDLAPLLRHDPEGYRRFMTDPGNIDYLGPAGSIDESRETPIGGDRPGNHGSHPGFYLFLDLSVAEQRAGFQVRPSASPPAGLSD